jgi:magnesium chelatase subunit D
MRSYFGRWKIKLSKKAPARRIRRFVGRRAATLTTTTRGRLTSYRKPKTPPKENIAFLPSIITSLVNRGKSEGKTGIKLNPSDLRIWVRQGRSPVTLVLIVDASFSTHHFLPAVSRALSVVYRDAYRNRDRLGVIAFQKRTAQIMNHPTNNLRVALGNLARLTPSGYTPLANGLRKALQMFKQEKRRSPDFIPFAILISDCFPEPLTHKYADLLQEPAYLDAIKVSEDFTREKIPIVVINPTHAEEKDGQLKSGTRLGMRIAQISKGRYYAISEKEIPSPYTFFAGRARKRYVERQGQAISEFLDDVRVDFLTIHRKGE